MRPHTLPLIGFLALSACDSATEPDFRNVHVNTSVTPVRGAVNHFLVTTSIENAGRTLLRIGVGTCPRRFSVETMSGEAVALSSQTCSTGAPIRDLAPGERYDLNNEWDGTDSNGTALAGEFRIVGQPFSTSGPRGNPVNVYLVAR